MEVYLHLFLTSALNHEKSDSLPGSFNSDKEHPVTLDRRHGWLPRGETCFLSLGIEPRFIDSLLPGLVTAYYYNRHPVTLGTTRYIKTCLQISTTFHFFFHDRLRGVAIVTYCTALPSYLDHVIAENHRHQIQSCGFIIYISIYIYIYTHTHTHTP
jgi:hypothetical protein